MIAVDPTKLHAISLAIDAFDDAARVLEGVVRDGVVDAAALPGAEAAVSHAFDVVERSPIMPWALYLPTPGPNPSGSVYMAQRMIDGGRPELALEHVQRATDAVHHAREGARHVLDGAQLPIADADALLGRMDWVPSNPSLSATTTRMAWDDLPIEVKAAIVPDGDLRVDLRMALRDIERGNAFETAYGTLDYADNSASAGLDALAARIKLASSNHAQRRVELAELVESGEQLTRREAFEVDYLAGSDPLHERLAAATIDERRSIVAADLTLHPADAWKRAWAELLPDQQAEVVPDADARELLDLLLHRLRGRSSARFDQHRRLALEIVSHDGIDDATGMLGRLRADAAAPVTPSPTGRLALLDRLRDHAPRAKRAGHMDVLHTWALLAGDRVLDGLPPADHARAAGRLVAAHGAIPEPSLEWFDGLDDALDAARAAVRANADVDESVAPILATVDELAQRNLDRLRGLRHDGYGTHPDYGELGRIAEALELVASIGRGSTREPDAATQAAGMLAW